MRNAKASLSALLFLACAAVAAAPSPVLRPARVSASQRTAAQAKLPQLTVSADRRYLVRADGTPFLYLSDTAWELFHRPTREQVRDYLALRARQKFTVIHAVALAELEGISDPMPTVTFP